MLKYLNVRLCDSEIPGTKALGIYISGCRIRCSGCPTRELWEDKGTILNVDELEQLLKQYYKTETVLLLGGEHDIDALTELLMWAHRRVKTAWYCGLDMVPRDKTGILQYLDYLKIGHYDEELGGLDSPSTNQRLYLIEHQADGNYQKTDITPLMQQAGKELLSTFR